jgi:hypothetical protein
MRRELYLVRPILYRSVKPYFGDGHFSGASLAQIARHLAASRSAGCADGTPARMAALSTKMLRCVERFVQYAHDGDGFQ